MAGPSPLTEFKWPPLDPKRTCEWCSATWIKEHFKQLGKLSWKRWPGDLLLDLQYCADCVTEYHHIREDFLEQNPGRKKDLWSSDVQRLSVFIKQALSNMAAKPCTTLEMLDKLENNSQHFESDDLKQALDVPILEILLYPELLFDGSLSALFQTALETLIDNNSPQIVIQRYPGVNILLIHPSKKIRKWAEKTVRRKKLSLADYDNCEWSFEKIIEVSTLNLFDFMPESHSDFSDGVLPSHLWSPNPSVYWNGFLKLLLSMDQEVINLKMMRVSEHKQIPDTLINTMEGNHGNEKAVFWTTFNCLVILIESCSSRFWPMMSHSPYVVLNLIKNHSVYSRALRHHLQNYDSQQSFQDFDLGSQEFPYDSLPRLALTWFETFVVSVLDFGDVALKCVSAVIKILQEYSGNKDVKIKIARILSRVIHSNRLSSLVNTVQLWLPHLLELAKQFDDTNKMRSETLLARESIILLLKRDKVTMKFDDFANLTEEKIQDIIKSIEQIIKQSPLKEAPKFKPNCARKSMSGIKIKKEKDKMDSSTTNDQPTSVFRESRISECNIKKEKGDDSSTAKFQIKTKERRIAECDVKKENVPTATYLNVKRKTKSPTITRPKLLSLVLKLEDCQKAGFNCSKASCETGTTKDCAINLDSDDDDRPLGKNASTSSCSSPGSSKRPLSDSDSDDTLYRPRKSKPKKKKPVIVSDSDDDTDDSGRLSDDVFLTKKPGKIEDHQSDEDFWGDESVRPYDCGAIDESVRPYDCGAQTSSTTLGSRTNILKASLPNNNSVSSRSFEESSLSDYKALSFSITEENDQFYELKDQNYDPAKSKDKEQRNDEQSNGSKALRNQLETEADLTIKWEPGDELLNVTNYSLNDNILFPQSEQEIKKEHNDELFNVNSILPSDLGNLEQTIKQEPNDELLNVNYSILPSAFGNLEQAIKREPNDDLCTNDDCVQNDNISNVSNNVEVREQVIQSTEPIKQEPNDEQFRIQYTDSEGAFIIDEIGKITRGMDTALSDDSDVFEHDDEYRNVEHYIPSEEIGVDYFDGNLIRPESESRERRWSGSSGPQDMELEYSQGELLDDYGVDCYNNSPRSLSQPEATDQGSHGYQQQSNFSIIEEENKSGEDESDDEDIVEIFFKPPSAVKVKVEKPDDISDESENIEPSVPESPPQSTAQPLSSCSAVASASSAPSRTFTTAKSLFSAPPAEINCDKIKVSEGRLMKHILSWKVCWLESNDRAEIAVYKVVEKTERLPKTFDTMYNYCESFVKLMVIEAFEQAKKDWRDPRVKRFTTMPVITSISPDKSSKIIRCVINDVPQTEITERDLLIVRGDNFAEFGLVEKVDQERVHRRLSSGSDTMDSCSDRTYNVTYEIRTTPAVNSSEGKGIELQLVTSLLTTFRQLSGLMSFSRQSLLSKDILRPRGMKYFCSEERPVEVNANEHYNKSQVRVIETAAEAVKHPLAIPRICLVQGPPGTGKSHAIVGMVTRILNQECGDSNQSLTSQIFPSHPRVLLCCPSNEGVDELVRKLMRAKPKMTRPRTKNGRKASAHKNCGDFSLVRVGRKSKIHETVKEVTLESMIQRAMVKEGFGELESTAPLRNKIHQIEKKIDEIQKKKYVLKEVDSIKQNLLKEQLEIQEKNYETKRQELKREYLKKKDLAKRSGRMEAHIKRDILNGADIVCTTLSGSGSTTLLNELRGSKATKIPFSCVIVDEACQCTELDTLIPLQYKSSKLILVGDPEQLPATVISKDAKKLLYGRSMFDRLYRYFKELPRHERPVHLLDVQYRMHPEIAHFPSKHVYNDNIHTDSSVFKRSFPIKKPYALFNVHGGRELNDRKGSICNLKEANLITQLCQCLIQNSLKPNDIGIITPYSSQRMELRKLLRYSGEVLHNIEVNTVDGFQGREKNVIIMSCVRSARNIGFLDCPNRLNVALTRARHALYVFGNLDSLEKSDSIWKKLIEDGKHRMLHYEVDSVDDVKRAINVMNSPIRQSSTCHNNSSGSHSASAHVHNSGSVNKRSDSHRPRHSSSISKPQHAQTTTKNEELKASRKDISTVTSAQDKPKTAVSKRRLTSDSDEGSIKKVRFGSSVKVLEERSGCGTHTYTQHINQSSAKRTEVHSSTKATSTLVHSSSTNHNASKSTSTHTRSSTNDRSCSTSTGQENYTSLHNSTKRTSTLVHSSTTNGNTSCTSMSTHSSTSRDVRTCSTNTPQTVSQSRNKNNKSYKNNGATISSAKSVQTTGQSNNISGRGNASSVNDRLHTTHPNRTSSNVSQRRLDEVAMRVRENNQRPPNPGLISTDNYRPGRAGRLFSLETWQPYGGPKNRIASTVSASSVRDVRTRGLQSGYTEHARYRPPKRPSLQQNLDNLSKKSKRK